MMKKWLMSILIAAAWFLCLSNNASAAETASTDSVYVAGNPDLYPFEYYDTQSDTYLGILPELYQQITQATGLEFVYIQPGMVNQQSRLAKNGQVDLVSAYVRGQVATADRELILLQCDENTEICIGFTSIISEDIEESIRTFLENMSYQQFLELAVAVPERLPERKIYWLAGIIGGLLLLTVITLTVILLRQRAAKMKEKDTRLLDPLTGIGNAVYFENTFRHYVTWANYTLYYVCYISLELQRIEQYLGTLEAEEIQRYAADILSQMAADGDFSARAGEGVFLMAFQAPSEEAAATRVTEILNRLNSYEEKFLEEYHVMFRAGVFWMDTANLPVETAVFNARQGYNTASHNKISCAFADKKMLNREAAKIKLQRKLSDALKNREFHLYLQMIVDQDGRIVGAEALPRWQNREEGLLSPGAFIEPLKAAGFIDKLDFYILEGACRQLEQWSKTEKGHLWLSCNFTRLTVSRSDFMVRFREVAGQYQFDPCHLIIELTEDSLMDNMAVAYRNILECKKMGFQIALDDLGSGYSSLQDLCDYPIDMIKIDRHILLKSVTPRGSALLQGLTKMGHDLGMKVLCEGVENEAENQNALKAGCDFIQGFYYSRVLPQDEANLFYMRKQKIE